MSAAAQMLEVRGLEAGYGAAQILFGVDLAVGPGEVATLIGRNGMGKTTTIRAVMGLLRSTAGSIRVGGRDMTSAKPHLMARAGLGLVPEGRQVFPTLSVRENLVATSAGRAGERRWTLERVFDLFPRLAERAGNLGAQLSGGEQQMLAIGRALMTNPQLLILDEATEGLAPLIRQEIWSCLAGLKADGEAILIVDKNIEDLARIADSHFVLEKGRIVWQGSNEALRSDPTVIDRHLHF
jgi:branched-chain amino acid transport system ATP-binding protein